MGERDEIAVWLAGRIPSEWFASDPDISVDRDEILIVGRLPAPEESGDEAVPEAINRFRHGTRAERTCIGRDGEREFGRKVSWGAECMETREIFTALGLPIMTRLRMEERAVLDALVDAGVARNRSQALAWCVRLVGQHQSQWINQLREALEQVETVRSQGPTLA